MPTIIDLNFLDKPNVIASFLVETEDGPVLIETGPYSTFPFLKKGIEKAGYQVEDIKHVLLTHIHLDHAGAAWAFAERGATVYVHPFGYKHLHDPSKLMKSARRIYQDEMDRLWGDMKPIPEGKLKEVGHEEKMEIGGILFEAFHTPGHAVHHIAWKVGKQLFSGDVAGVKIEDGLVVPPCPPPDINIEDWLASIKLIRQLELSGIFLTHYGKIESIDAHLNKLEEQLTTWSEWMYPYYKDGISTEEVTPKFQQFVRQQLKEAGASKELVDLYEAANPSWMSVAGLLRYWRKKEGG